MGVKYILRRWAIMNLGNGANIAANWRVSLDLFHSELTSYIG